MYVMFAGFFLSAYQVGLYESKVSVLKSMKGRDALPGRPRGQKARSAIEPYLIQTDNACGRRR